MTLPSEVRQAAEILGQALSATDTVREYLGAQARLEQDWNAHSLETAMNALHQDLTARYQAGEKVGREEVDGFNALRTRAWSHPLITARDLARIQLGRYLADVALDLGIELGADYRTLAMGK
jgi:cell fate (sporulation/competence/biofilm development) regulator YlbF (YheA/YmcA/DUF963 family)